MGSDADSRGGGTDRMRLSSWVVRQCNATSALDLFREWAVAARTYCSAGSWRAAGATWRLRRLRCSCKGALKNHGHNSPS